MFKAEKSHNNYIMYILTRKTWVELRLPAKRFIFIILNVKVCISKQHFKCIVHWLITLLHLILLAGSTSSATEKTWRRKSRHVLSQYCSTFILSPQCRIVQHFIWIQWKLPQFCTDYILTTYSIGSIFCTIFSQNT